MGIELGIRPEEVEEPSKPEVHPSWQEGFQSSYLPLWDWEAYKASRPTAEELQAQRDEELAYYRSLDPIDRFAALVFVDHTEQSVPVEQVRERTTRFLEQLSDPPGYIGQNVDTLIDAVCRGDEDAGKAVAALVQQTESGFCGPWVIQKRLLERLSLKPKRNLAFQEVVLLAHLQPESGPAGTEDSRVNHLGGHLAAFY